MPRLPRYRANTSLVLLSATAGLSIMPACEQPDLCFENLDAIAACDRFIATEWCATPAGRCEIACWATLSCEAWDEYAEGRLRPKTGRCLLKCSEKFQCEDGSAVLASWQCDGTEDCADGSDEHDCDYFLCGDGKLLPEDYACDGFAQCEDGSDEEGCKPWCDDGETSSEDYECAADCDYESDDEVCE